MKIGISADHNGYEMKEKIINLLKDKHEIIDYGNLEYDPSDDFPVYAFKLGEHVASQDVSFGVTICGTGIGVSIACNKVKGIRCAKVDSVKDVILAKKHNNANVIAFSSNIKLEDAIIYIDTFVNTDFLTEERYQRRNDIISNYENGEYNEL